MFLWHQITEKLCGSFVTKEEYSTRKSLQCDIGLFCGRLLMSASYVGGLHVVADGFIFHFHRKGAEEIQSKPNQTDGSQIPDSFR